MRKNIFPVYKPKGPTSYQVVKEIKKTTGQEKVWHAGTLDPSASSVLVIGLGKGTKKLHSLAKTEKEYRAKIKLGEISTTDDEEGEKRKIYVTKKPSLKRVKGIIRTFGGQIQQIPPQFSAVKIGGKPAYRLARSGKKVRLKPRNVSIKKIQLIQYHWPFLVIKITTGPGVYIRALARDIGKKLKVGGYLAELERTRVGNFEKRQHLQLNNLQKLGTNRKILTSELDIIFLL